VEGFILLCDFAEVLDGKLYVMGGGWTRIQRAQPTFSVSIAGKVLIPWAEVGHSHAFAVTLMDSDRKPVLHDDKRVGAFGEIGQDPPPGLDEGQPLDLPIAFRFDGLNLDAGSYSWVCTVDDEHLAEAAFTVIVPD
jgi:uncharacterized protein DUF6941